jgi:hypothetical protein
VEILTNGSPGQKLDSKGRAISNRVARLSSALILAAALMAGCATPVSEEGGELDSPQQQSSPAPNQSEPAEGEKLVPLENSVGQAPGAVTEVEPEPTRLGPSNAPETPKAEPGQEPTSEPPQTNAIPWSKVEENVSMESCWIVLRDKVYDFSQVVQQHPFGQQLRMAVCGKDATETFQANADINEVISRLEPFYLGPVG